MRSKILEAREIFGENFDHLNLEKYQLGTLGCYLSHYLLLKKIQSECLDQEYVLILEDDCHLDRQSLSQIDQTIETLEEWDILRSTWSAPNWLRKIEYSHPLLSTYNVTMNKLIYKNLVAFYHFHNSQNALHKSEYFELGNPCKKIYICKITTP